MSGSNARIRDSDLKAPNAYVHIVDNLLLPKDSLAAVSKTLNHKVEPGP